MPDILPDSFSEDAEEVLREMAMAKQKPVTVVEDDITTGEALRRKLWIDTYSRIVHSRGGVDAADFAEKAVMRYDKWLRKESGIEEVRQF